MQACAGLRIVEISKGLGTPALCGQLFAGLAASVELIDFATTADTDHQHYLHRLLHQGKAQTADPAAIEAAVDAADIVILDRSIAGLPEAISDARLFEERWPDKILCAISLFGAGNDRSDWIGNELVTEAASALMACNGYPEWPPIASGLPYALHTSALFAFGAIMTALRERDVSRRGQSIDLAVIDCITAILGNFLPSYFLSSKEPKRIGNRHTIAAPWNLYPASDGAVVICTGTGGTGWWAKVMAVIDRPELTNDPRYATEADRVRNVEEVDAIMSDWTSERTMKDIVDRMNAYAIPAGEISTVEMVLDDPHFRELREMVLDGAASNRPLMGNPLKVGAWDAAVAPPAPIGKPAPRSIGKGALAGIRVVEFASRTSVPLAGRLMRDFGADVVKIEPVKGDALRGAGQQIAGSSYLFHINNAGKRSVMIDPTTEAGRDLILELVAQADVFVENLAPGSVEKMGLGPEAMRARNPALVYCSVSGFGARSAYGEKRALDTVVQAASGLMHMTGYPDHKAVKLGISAVDLTTATAALAAILAGLRQRDRTGAGLYIDLAMADVGVWMTQAAWPQLICGGVHPIRLGNRSADASPHDIFEAADGSLVAIAVLEDAHWRALASLLGNESLQQAQLDTLAARVEQADRIHAAIAEWTRARPGDDAAALCQSAGIPASVVRNLGALVDDPLVAERDMIVNIDIPGAGTLRLLGNPAKLSRTPPALAGAAPSLGADTAQVLEEWLGMGADEIAALANNKVILAQRAEDMAGV
ncbi:CaiB/BaiF CoA-transferase family protein [Sphingobium fuliginis]|uniref:CAIB family protein n=1 Tax=Sphingobium fuliginis (strain ATCC 27551) TaxID=336203 RepID=A0A292ZHA5_SPHSA|nr:CoA transferase [Sphingobium fuliginis]GAY22219.1 CAIB family protein [Sphingobium fuliginis]